MKSKSRYESKGVNDGKIGHEDEWVGYWSDENLWKGQGGSPVFFSS